MARPFEMINDINDKKQLWKLAVKVHHKWKVTPATKKYFEMLVADKRGHDIHVIVSTMFRQSFDSALLVDVTYTMSNFQVLPNDLLFRPSNQKYILKFTGGTTIRDVGKHDIPDKICNLTPFADIILEKWQRNLLTDVI
ncbi:unnamed protein product [Lathyrus sativus]|nr:unnamed protein product [Lathyrus sativus]